LNNHEVIAGVMIAKAKDHRVAILELKN
jgi:hypothetical protein